jgi:hypothetical protein
LDIVPFVDGFDKAAVFFELDVLAKDGLLTIDEDKKYHIRFAILAPNLDYRSEGLYDYRHVQTLISKAPAQSIPDRWINENVYAIPQRDQGERGTCVGQATAYAADLNAIKLTSWRPDLSQTKRNDIVDKSGTKFIKDTLPDNCSSAECSFITSRELGGIRPDQFGSFIDFSIKAWQKTGICSNSLWWNPKSATFDNYEAYPAGRDQSIIDANQHTIEGYAAIKDFEDIKRAIYTNGFVLMAINVYDNWCDNAMQGLFPEPNSNCIGSHALCWVGYDEDHLYCIHSWDGWSMLGGISRNYWKIAAQTAYVPLDEHETFAAKTIYHKLTVSTNVLCNIKINTDTYKKTQHVSGAFDPSTPVSIVATPVDTDTYDPASHSRVGMLSSDLDLNFEFVKKNVLLTLLRNIMAKLKTLWRH